MSAKFLPSVLAAILVCPTVLAQSTFHGLGDLPGGAFDSIAWNISRDGLAVVGTATSAAGRVPFRWTAMDGMVAMGDLPGGPVAGEGGNASPQGRYVVGSSAVAGGSEAFRWNAADGMVSLGDLPGGTNYSVAWAATGDGSTVIGIGNTDSFLNSGVGEAFRWTSSGGISGMGFLEPADVFSWAIAMSTDGQAVVGLSAEAQGFSGEAFRWTPSMGMVGLGLLPDDLDFSAAWGVSADGNVCVGEAHALVESVSVAEAVYWNGTTGPISLGHNPLGGTYDAAFSCSADGRVIVGIYDFDATGGIAFVWDAANGMRDLKSVLQNNHGLDLTGWTLQWANGVSDDAQTIVGYGVNPSGNTEAWIARLENQACTADLDDDGGVGLSDLAILLSAFGGLCP